MNKIDIVVEFVEGKISTEEFKGYLYKDKDIEELLSEDLNIPPYTKDGSLYLYLIQIDLASPGDLLDAQDALGKFLDVKKIPYKKDDAPKKIYGILLKAQPKWLDLPDFYLKKILPADLGKNQNEIVSLIKENIAKDFVCLKNPPKWLQSPRWMFKDERPLKFIGQLDISGLRHDTAQLYVFYDEKTGEFSTCEQVA